MDDVASNRKLLAFHLRRLGFQCEFAENGAEAVAMFAAVASRATDHFPWTLVLMDSVMPVMSGLVATRKLRQAGFTALILGVTGNALQEDIAEFVEAGVNDVITKPVKLKQVRAALEQRGLLAS